MMNIILWVLLIITILIALYLYWLWRYTEGRFHFKYTVDDMERWMKSSWDSEYDTFVYHKCNKYHPEWNKELWDKYCDKKNKYNLRPYL